MQETIKTRSGRVIILPTADEEIQINAGIAADTSNPEWTDADSSRALPAREFFSPKVFDELCSLRQRGDKTKPLKVPTTIRFDADILAALKSSGKGWQTRVNDAIREWLKTHSPASL